MKNKEKNFLSAVIYVHNAENRIESFLQTIIAAMENFEYSEIICVNDHSIDNSVGLIKQVCKAISATSVSLVNMSYFHGLEMAMHAGVDLAIGDYIFEFDNVVLDFDQETIMKVYRRALEGYDIVSASSDKKEKITSRLFYQTFNFFTDSQYKMSTESFRILSRRMINRVSSVNKTVPYRKAIYAGCGLRSDNIKYNALNNVHISPNGKEKRYRSNLAVDSLIIFTKLGYRFSIVMTVLMMLTSLFMVVYSILVYATSHPVAGWTTIILFMSVIFLGLFAILTIVIKYLQLLIELIFKKKHYSFESIEKITK